MKSCGSGVIVAIEAARKRALIITCRHVLPNDPEAKLIHIERFDGRQTAEERALFAAFPIVVQLSDGRQFGACWLAADPKADLAACMIEGDGLTAAELADAEPKRGASIYQAGYPGGVTSLNRRTGAVIGYNGMRGQAPVWFLSMACRGGDSGSGIFTSEGKLTAILWGGSGNETCCTGLQDLKRFVETCHRWVRPGQPPRPPSQPTPPVQPTEPLPPAMPPGPTPSPGVDLGPLLAEIAAMRRDLAALQLKPGIPGKDGERGKDGKDGRDGKDGKAGDSAALLAEIETLRAQIRALESKFNNLSGSVRIRVDPVQK